MIAAWCGARSFARPPTPPRTSATKPAALKAATLRDRLDQILVAPKPAGTLFSGRVIELPSGRVLYDHEGERPLMPASNMKLVVMAAALDLLRWDFRFETLLGVRDDDLVVIGGGDPTMGDEKLSQQRREPVTALFHQWASKLKASGVREIRGDLLIDDFLFDDRYVHRNWPADQYEAWYEAPIGALNFNSNCVDVQLAPSTRGQPAVAQLVPGNGWIQLQNYSATGPKQSVSVHRARESDTLLVRGAVAKAQRVGPIAVGDPGMYFGHVLKTVLAAEGIPLSGRVVRRRVSEAGAEPPLNCRIIDVHTAPLTDALARCGKDSLGMMAEGIFKLLGSRQASVGTWETGRAAIEAYLRKAGAAAGQFRVDDGSGLSRENRLSAAASTAVLRFAFLAGQESFDALREALSRAGIDGTLKKRMRNSPTRGRVFAKTGYINGVRTLSGYAHTLDGRWLAFAFFYNGTAKTRPLSRMQDEACEVLVSWTGPK